ncbi:MAG: DNA mismatch repair endonuclease MutL, partial [Oscillospiraceae bacterium]
MPDINILSPHVADMIAAGEVVERPASVIKELLENSFDAGSKNITIEIKGGGMTYIRVTDDGGGMLPEDAGLCFLRHATSKLRDERGLESIGTMGFRGEALAAVSSVSRVELLTKKRGTDVGTRVVLEAGDIIEMLPCGCPEGTTMIIRDLFFNTPARLKFMKSDRTESSACSSAALRCALGHPDVSVRLIKDGEDEFFSPGDGKLESCVYSLLGRETAMGLLELASNCEKVSVSGFVGSPKAGHGNRSKQFFFCNKRSIKSQLLQAAVEQAYKNTLLTGRYPACVVYLSVSPGAVDVNVHPAKTEVKFRDERQIFDAVYYAVLSALDGEKSAAEINLQPLVKSSPSPKKDFFKSMNAGEFREKYSGLPKTSGSTFPPRSSESLSHAIPPKPSPDIDKGTIVWNRTLSSGTSGASLVRESESPYISS